MNLLFIEDDAVLSRPGTVRTIYDPASGTGAMLAVASEHLCEINSDARLTVFGQELNAESFAIYSPPMSRIIKVCRRLRDTDISHNHLDNLEAIRRLC